MPFLILLLLLGFSCQSVDWREPVHRDPPVSLSVYQDQDSDTQNPEALGSRRFPRSVVVTEQDKKGDGDSSADTAKTSEVGIYVMTGVRRIQSSVFDEQQDMQATGAEFVWMPKGWSVGLEIGVQWSKNETETIIDNWPATVEGFMAELYAGPRIQGQLVSLIGYPISAYVGGGVTGMFVNIERERNGSQQSDKDFGYGWYAHTGFFVPGPGKTIFGVDLRWVGDSELDLFGEPSSADGFQVSILAAIEF